MSCERIVEAQPDCCSLEPVSELETLTANFYDCIRNTMNEYVSSIYSQEMFGNVEKSDSYANALNDLHYLYAYMVIIYFQRQEDKLLDTDCNRDKGSAYYYEEYKIDCIKRYFKCRNIDISSMLNTFGLTKTNTIPDGINFMCIDACVDDTPNCSDDNELFIVNKL